MLIGDILRRTANRLPDKVGLVFGETRLTWREVDSQANSLANGLQDMGLKKGDKVGILLKNCPEYLVAYYALAKAGLLDIPINWRLSERELGKLQAFLELDALIVGDTFLPNLERMGTGLLPPDRRICVGEDVPPGVLDYQSLVSRYPTAEPQISSHEEDAYVIMSTGGTTGAAKGAVLAHRQHFLVSLVCLATVDVVESDVALVGTPLFHGMALTGMSLPVTHVGGTMVILDRFEPEAFLEAIQKERVSYFAAAPTMLRALTYLPTFHEYDISSLKRCVYGSAPMATTSIGEVLDQFPAVHFYQSYGATECQALTRLDPQDQLRKSHTAGKVSLDVDLRVVDDEGREMGVGQVGEILVRSDRLFKGYYRLPQETAEAMRDGWFHTGDLGCLDEEGFLTIVDRKKDMIISGGENIYSKEVEEVLYAHPAVAEAAVIGVPDEKWGEAVHAVVALKDGHRLAEQEVIDFCKANLASYKKPRSVEFVAELPKLPTNKINKRELRDTHWKVGREDFRRVGRSDGDEPAHKLQRCL